MNCFTQLLEQSDEAALLGYFRTASPEDAAWAVWLLVGNRPKRSVSTEELIQIVAEETALPRWLIEESHRAAGDWGETTALLLDTAGVSRMSSSAIPLSVFIKDRLLPLAEADSSTKRKLLGEAWRELALDECRVFHKLITGSFRSVFTRRALARCLATIAGLEYSVMAYRLTRNIEATTETYEALMARRSDEDAIGKPYPFCLFQTLNDDPGSLGKVSDWQIERKWDGLRVQLIKRRGEMLIWSEHEEFVTADFSEIEEAGRCLPDGTVLEGQILAESDPASFVAQEVLEFAEATSGRDGLERVYDEWMRSLKQGGELRQGDLFAAPEEATWPVMLSPLLNCETWIDVKIEVDRSREMEADGVLLKKNDGSPPWIWRPEPLGLKAVLLAAQARDGVYSDYTFGVWDGEELVSIGQAASGLVADEIAEIDAFVRDNTTQNRGPVRIVVPRLVFELSFEGTRKSKRHQSGLMLRNPRILRWLRDEPVSEAWTLDRLKNPSAI